MNKINDFVFIIGAMKCGTTSLFEYLSQHPQISPCTQKEPNFFSNNDKWSKGLEWYLNLWQWDPNSHQIALEASVNYSKVHLFPHAAYRIAALEANCKFIYIVRNPIERIKSHCIHGVANCWEGYDSDFSEEIISHTIQTSKYAKQLDVYSKVFSKENILLLTFEELKYNPRKLLKQVCQFLNLRSDYEFDVARIHNANKGRVADHALYFFTKRYKVLQSIGALVPSNLKQPVRNSLKYKLKVDIRLSRTQQNFIVQELKEDLIELKHKYDVDISSWNIDI